VKGPGGSTDLPPVFHHETVRTARVAHLGPRGARPLWVALHGYRQLAPWFLRRFAPLDDGSRRIVAPEALNRFYAGDPDGRHGSETRVGATWMTREDRESEIADYVRYLDDVLHAEGDGAHPLVLGFSQGAHTAARWCLAGAVRPRAVVLWGEGLPHDVDRTALGARDHRWILVRGAADPTRDPAREARDEVLLRDVGAAWEVVEHAGGHRVEGEALTALAARLEAQPPTNPISGSSS
jgi:predicted esterase